MSWVLRVWGVYSQQSLSSSRSSPGISSEPILSRRTKTELGWQRKKQQWNPPTSWQKEGPRIYPCWREGTEDVHPLVQCYVQHATRSVRIGRLTSNSRFRLLRRLYHEGAPTTLKGAEMQPVHLAPCTLCVPERRGQFLPEPASKTPPPPLLEPGALAVMLVHSPSKDGANNKSATLRQRPNAFSWRRGLCYTALLATTGWAIFSFSSVHKDARASPAAFASREGERKPSVVGAEDTSLVPAPWDPQGCQTVVFFHIPKTGGESLNNLWQVTAGSKQRRRLFGWAGYRLMGLRRTDLSLQQQEEYLTNM